MYEQRDTQTHPIHGTESQQATRYFRTYKSATPTCEGFFTLLSY
jgi:hypothetical protein